MRTPEKQKEYSARKALNLTDSYVANCMRMSVNDLRAYPYVIELAREIIKAKRELKELK
jgi:hypothetical protein